MIVYRALTTQFDENDNADGSATPNLPLEGKVSAELTDEVETSYPDLPTVADYAKDAVSALIGAGLVNGKNGNIAPTDYTTRAEVAVLLKRILDYIE